MLENEKNSNRISCQKTYKHERKRMIGQLAGGGEKVFPVFLTENERMKENLGRKNAEKIFDDLTSLSDNFDEREEEMSLKKPKNSEDSEDKLSCRSSSPDLFADYSTPSASALKSTDAVCDLKSDNYEHELMEKSSEVESKSSQKPKYVLSVGSVSIASTPTLFLDVDDVKIQESPVFNSPVVYSDDEDFLIPNFDSTCTKSLLVTLSPKSVPKEKKEKVEEVTSSSNGQWWSKKTLKQNKKAKNKKEAKPKSGQQIYKEFCGKRDYRFVDPLRNEKLCLEIERKIAKLSEPSDLSAEQVNFLVRKSQNDMRAILDGEKTTKRSLKFDDKRKRYEMNSEVPIGFFKQEIITLTSELLSHLFLNSSCSQKRFSMVSLVLLPEMLVTFYSVVKKLSREVAEVEIERDFYTANKNSFEWN